jgi:hypothetical protein
MKKIFTIILLAVSVAAFQSCKDEVIEEPVVPPVTKPEPVNTFKFNGITTYNLKWDSTNMYANYKASEDMTTVTVDGYSNNKRATFTLKFPGNKVGTYKRSAIPEVNVEVTTGENVTYKQYVFSTQPGMDMTITVSKFDGIGGRIKGTFSANLQSSGSLETATITAGAFEARVE